MRKRFSVDGCQSTSGPCHFSDAPLFRPPSRMQTPPAVAEQLLREPAFGNKPFLLHVAFQSGLQRVKAKVPFPQFLLHHGRDNPHHESLGLLVSEVPESENPTQSLRFRMSEKKKNEIEVLHLSCCRLPDCSRRVQERRSLQGRCSLGGDTLHFDRHLVCL